MESCGFQHGTDGVCRCICQSEDTAFPSVTSRLNTVAPSRDLLDHLRKKILQLEKDYEEISSQISTCRSEFEEESKLRKVVGDRELEVSKLQKAVSDMQVHLFRERDRVHRLNAENDRLNLKQLEDKKIIDHLLGMIALPDREVTVFRERMVLDGKLSGKGNAENIPSVGDNVTNVKYDVLKKQVSSLQNQIHTQRELSKREIEALIEDRRIRNEEHENETARNLQTIANLTEKLRRVEMKLTQYFDESLEKRKKCHVTFHNELAQSRKCKNAEENLDTRFRNGQRFVGDVRLAEEVKEAEKNVIKVSPKLCKKFTERPGSKNNSVNTRQANSLREQLALYKKRYQDLERRRHLEVEGFKSDIKLLREKLTKVEGLLNKVTLIFERVDPGNLADAVKLIKSTCR